MAVGTTKSKSYTCPTLLCTGVKNQPVAGVVVVGGGGGGGARGWRGVAERLEAVVHAYTAPQFSKCQTTKEIAFAWLQRIPNS